MMDAKSERAIARLVKRHGYARVRAALDRADADWPVWLSVAARAKSAAVRRPARLVRR